MISSPVRPTSFPLLAALALTAACDLGSSPSPSRDDRRVPASPARPGAVTSPSPAPLPAAGGTIAAAAGAADPAPPANAAPPAPPAQLATPQIIAKLDEGGCGLIGSDAKYVYARAASNDVLLIDRASSTVETKKLPSPMLVQTAFDGVPYGCMLGESRACKLTRVPLDGGAAKPVAALPGLIDGPNAAERTMMAGVFVPVSADGALDLAREEHSIETVDLESGARSVVAGQVGVGKALLGPKGVLFEGAMTPRENVGAASWGLWLLQAGAAPRRLPVTSDGRAFSADERHAYFINERDELWRIGLDGTGEQQLSGAIEVPPREPGKLGVTPAVRAAGNAVYVSTANTTSCWVWRIDVKW